MTSQESRSSNSNSGSVVDRYFLPWKLLRNDPRVFEFRLQWRILFFLDELKSTVSLKKTSMLQTEHCCEAEISSASFFPSLYFLFLVLVCLSTWILRFCSKIDQISLVENVRINVIVNFSNRLAHFSFLTTRDTRNWLLRVKINFWCIHFCKYETWGERYKRYIIIPY